MIIRNYRVVSLAAAFACFWVPIIIFCKIAGEILERKPIGLDNTILQAIHSHATTFYDSFFVAVTNLGSAEVLAPLTLLIAICLLSKRLHAKVLILLAGVGGASVANVVLKMLFQRQRPSFWPSLVSEHSYSFPSGHAMASSAFALCVILILWRTKWRWAAVIGGGLYIVLIGLSRLYLGVHYPTDIVAGWAVSAVWVLIVSSLVTDFPFALRSRIRQYRNYLQNGPKSGMVKEKR